MLSKLSRRLATRALTHARALRASNHSLPVRSFQLQTRSKTGSVSAPLAPEPPFPTASRK